MTYHQDEENEEDERNEPDGSQDSIGGLDGRVVEVAQDLPELRKRREHDRAVLLHLKFQIAFTDAVKMQNRPTFSKCENVLMKCKTV